MTIFEFKNYRKFLRARLATLPARGRGELTKIASALEIHTTMVSHVMKGSVDFSLEQTLKLAQYLGFNPLETDYLVALVQHERAGDAQTRAYCQAKVEQIKAQASDIKTRLKATNELSDADRAQYYSSPMYAFVRLLTAIERFETFEAIREETQLAPKRLREILEFLINRGLCDEKGARYLYANKSTYVEAGSPMVARHHMNWRQKAQERMENLRPEDLVFTYPTAMSEEDFQIVREKLVQFIEEFRKLSGPSPSEELYCLNVDWLKVSRG